PRAELAVGLPQQPVRLLLQLADFVGDVDVAAVGEVAQLRDLAFEFGDRLFEIEIGRHPLPWQCVAASLRRGRMRRRLLAQANRRRDWKTRRVRSLFDSRPPLLRRANAGEVRASRELPACTSSIPSASTWHVSSGAASTGATAANCSACSTACAAAPTPGATGSSAPSATADGLWRGWAVRP